MAKEKPSISSGTRDFGPAEVAKRNYIIDMIRYVYELYGYQPLETPAMENLSTLLGKYGDEGDKLLFRILNSGDFLKDADDNSLKEKNAAKLLSSIAEKGLRYDLTVPFARYVVMNQNAITFPFKRYQIQPVWRADRPQKGRYREFYQCDADVIGSKSILCDAELVMIIRDVFEKLKLNVTIKLNNRKILDGIAAYSGAEERMMSMTVAIDKLDKIGEEGVKKELSANGFTEEQVNKIISVIQLKGTFADKINFFENNFQSEKGKQGIAEIKELFDKAGTQANTEFDLTLARGLSYYTGTIYEVVCRDVKMGSILGGGRYDDLTGIFGLPDMSGVGISFGLDRIYDVLTELNLFPASALLASEVIFIPFDADAEKAAVGYASQLRKENIRTEIYPDISKKMDRKLKYANDKKIKYVIFIGSNELSSGKLSVKNLDTGEQHALGMEEFISQLREDAVNTENHFDVSE